MSPTHQDLSNDTTFSQIKSRVPVPLSIKNIRFLAFVNETNRRFDFWSLCFDKNVFSITLDRLPLKKNVLPNKQLRYDFIKMSFFIINLLVRLDL